MPRISHAQNGEDIRVWRAMQSIGESGPGLTYVDVGANEPRSLSITASLYDLGWRGLLIEADPVLAAELRVHRPGDTVVEAAASAVAGMITFHRVPGTGLGTLDAAEAATARGRGFAVEEIAVPALPLNDILTEHLDGPVHFMSIDVEGAESQVLAGLDLGRHRPWILCIEAVLPGTSEPSHDAWEPDLLARGYGFVTFDGVNRWYVAAEHAELTAQVEALDRWLADHPDIAAGELLQSEDRSRRPRGQLTFDLMGTPITTSLRAFSVFKLQSVTDAFDRLDPAGRESVRAWLAPLGLAQWLDLKARRRIERIGNREVWAGLPE